MDNCIQRYIRRQHGISIGSFEAERIKIDIGSAAPLSEPIQGEVTGIDASTGMPRTIQLTDAMIREALDNPVRAIVESIRNALSKSSPELASDIRRRGIVLAGGGSLLKGLGARLHAETDLPIFRAKDPLTAIVRGTGYVLDNLVDLKKVCLN
jgi:rod shape-determining protein MreB